MKNIAIPLLLAGSAKAEAKKKAAMLLDYAEPEPILIASSWTGDVCVDAAGDVAQALSDLQAAQSEVEELEEGVLALQEAEDDAWEARETAVADVIALDEAMDADVEANNEAIANLIGLKEAWQEANVNAAIGEALVASTLAARNTAEGDYDAAVEAYAGNNPSSAEEADGVAVIAGLLAETTDAEQLLDQAEQTRDGSAAGSLTYRNAAHIDYACKNCTGADNGSAGDSDFTVQCGGAYQSGESYVDAAGTTQSFPGVYTNSLATLETAVDDEVTQKATDQLAEAAKYLLKIQHGQIKTYLGWAVTNGNDDITYNGSNADPGESAYVDFDTSTSYLTYQGTESDIFTHTEMIAEMAAGIDTLTVDFAHGITGTGKSKAKAWVEKLTLVYGYTAGNKASDGDCTDATCTNGTVNSQEFDIIQTGSTGSADWVADATAKVQALKAYLDVYNPAMTAEAASAGTAWITSSDGLAGAFTNIDNDSGYETFCATAAGNSASVTMSSLYDGSATYTKDWVAAANISEIGGSSDAGIDAGSGAVFGALSVCAKACVALDDYTHDANTNLPDNTTQTDSNACTGFSLQIAGGAPACMNWFGMIPAADAAETTGDDAGNACYKRNASELAKTYVDQTFAVATDSGNFDSYTTASTNWDTAFQNLIDARAELDIAKYYHTQLYNVLYDTTATVDNIYGFIGYDQQYDYTDGSSVQHGALVEYTTAQSTYDSTEALVVSTRATYSARSVLIASSESDYLLAQAQYEKNNALIGKLTVLHEIALAASDAAFQTEEDMDAAYEEAIGDYQNAEDNYDGVEATSEVTGVVGLVELQTDAQEAYTDAEEAITGESGTGTALGEYEDGGDGDLGTLFGLRAAATDAYNDLVDAMQDLTYLNGEITGAQGEVEEALAVHLAAIVECKVENYDAYTETLQLAQQQREDDLDDILALVTEAEEDEPAAGAAGSRCEKALSNGTFRPQRGEGTCNEGLCCGAARIPQGNVMMTIETCQAVTETSYSYVPPRAPMATEPPAAEVVDFVCIEGAKKLAAAASALATAVYMLA